jgi:putative ABC transport system substrate-binding protein
MLVAALLSAFLAASAHAQEPGRTYRVGVLTLNREHLVQMPRDMLPRLAQSGFSEGRNLVFDIRVGLADQMPGLARDLATRSDVIVVVGISALLAAREATRTVPIVALTGANPVYYGWAQSLNRPGGNFTGIFLIGGVDDKRVERLHEAVPTARRIALLTTRIAGVPGSTPGFIAAMATGGVAIRIFYADRLEEYPAAFAAMREEGTEALVIIATPQFANDIEQLLALAWEARLPTACAEADMVRVRGCMLSYGENFPALRRGLADYVARILGGASPAEMPIEQPTHYEMAVNLRTARALGLTLPQTLLDLADEVIE